MNIDKRRLTILEEFDMPQLGRTRTVRIYLPEEYSKSCNRYPVMYMHDGQNVLEDETATYGTCWRAGTTLDKLQKHGAIDGCIVVAIDCGDEFEGMCRYHEYSPWKMDDTFELPGRQDIEMHRYGGEGERYIDFICSTLKPYMDNQYRTESGRDSTILAGSSMGGYISLFGGIERSDVFGTIGVFSPAFWFNRHAMLEYVRSNGPKMPLKVYMDMGTNETSDDTRKDFAAVYLSGSREMRDILGSHEAFSLFYQEEEGHEHNEAAWALRFPKFVTWALQK